MINNYERMFKFLCVILGLFLLKNSRAQTSIDTIERSNYFLSGDSSINIERIIPQKINKILLASINTSSSKLKHSIISKISTTGEILWSRVIDNNLDSNIQFIHALELTDESIAVYGICINQNPPNDIKHLIIRLNSSGNITSYKAFRINISLGIEDLKSAFLCELENNDIGLLLNLKPQLVSSAFLIARISTSNNISWSKAWFSTTDEYEPFGILKINSNLFIPGKFGFSSSSCNPAVRKGGSIMKLNFLNGNILASKSFCYSSGDPLSFTTNLSALSFTSEGLLKVFSHNTDKTGKNIICLDYDTMLNVVNSKTIVNLPGFNYISQSYATNNNGVFAFSEVDPLDKQNVVYMVMDSSFKILQQRKVRFSSQLPDINCQGSLSKDNRLSLLYSVTNNKKGVIESLETGVYNCDTTCIGSNINFASVQDFPVTSSNTDFLQSLNNVFINIPFTINLKEITLQKTLVCQSINTSDNVKIKGVDTICNINSAIIYTALNKNKCRSTITWTIDTAAYSKLSYLSDTAISIKFKKEWQGFLYATTQGDPLGKDSLYITVLKKNRYSELKDTSFCEGNFVELDAGTGFSSYLWGSGAKTRFIKLSEVGEYYLQAFYKTGCFIRDTMEIRNVFPKPKVSLNRNLLLCRGASVELDAGTGFVNYLWQDSSMNQTFLVKNPGLYWVQVKDTNGCFNRDSTLINKIVDTPSNFIFRDTTICISQTIQLKTSKNFTNYYWSTGSTLPFIKIHTSGVYHVSVKDANGCIGRAIINVKTKNCINNLVFPNAFSANHDGKNDVFKPYLTGILHRYELKIFNRWGQKIFHTNNPNEGWNGYYKLTLQNTESFIWVCSYQFEGENEKIQRGTFVLVH